MYVETQWILMIVAVWVENSIISFIWNFQPISPSLTISNSFIFFIGWILIDQIPNIFIDNSSDPSWWSRIELQPLFLFLLKSPNFYFFTRYRTVYLIDRWLLNRFRNECFLGWWYDRKRITKIMLSSVLVPQWTLLHLHNYLLFIQDI